MKSVYIACAALLLPLLASAKVQLPQFFTDSMVVQHDAVLTVPGTAKKGATVKITPSWAGAQTVKAKADKQGRFKAQLQTPPCGGPYTITFDDGQKTTLSDVWAGEVWFCSGQSNMEMPVQGWGRVMDYRREVANADYPMLRLLQVQKQTAYGEKDDTEVTMGGWRSATPETVANFSSIGYFFGRQLDQELGVPVGIIDCTWGGTPIESWMDYDVLQAAGEFAPELQAIKDCGFDEQAILADYNARLEKWSNEVLPVSAGFDLAQMQSGWKTMPVPGLWEDTVLPDFDGVVWMQKEVDLKPSQVGQCVLSLSMIDDQDVAYVNGQQVGASANYSDERSYAVPASLLKPGKNVITVRVVDTGGGGGFWGEAPNVYLATPDGKISLAGNWNYMVASDFVDNPVPSSPVSPNYPTVLYNAMMHPLTVMPVKGVLWYQGCTNVGRAEQYSKLFKEMIKGWRADWGQPDMPFYFVQLAGYLKPLRFQPNSQWAALRQAQKDALELPGVGMAVAIDLGNPDDIHPKNKQEVARRLADMALNNQYGKMRVCTAPEVEKVEVDGRYVKITFDSNIMQHGGGQGYVVKGADGQWAVGYGRVAGPNVIEVSSDEIADPVEVRYDWADCPDGNLRGPSGLPVAPFIAKK